MTFCGVEVKPGAPVTHSEKARLRLTRATLGRGNGTKKSIVQCNVEKKSPVIICSMFPGKFQSCTLSLQYEEADDVVFSVIGPHSVHLTGYYMEPVCGYNPDDESYVLGNPMEKTLVRLAQKGLVLMKMKTTDMKIVFSMTMIQMPPQQKWTKCQAKKIQQMEIESLED